MIYRLRLRATRAFAALLPVVLVLPCGATVGSAQGAGDRPLPAHVEAIYKVSFTALGNIGSFRFDSDIAGEAYNLSANAKVHTAIFDYNAAMKSNGAVVAAGSVVTRPADHSFNYRQKTFLRKKKVKGLNMTFSDATVTKVAFVPPEGPPKGPSKAIPVKPEQLRNVLDPLSGVMALSLAHVSNPCDQKLPIYDGKQRFDVVFTPARRAGTDHVCNVRLVPISGHKPGEGSASVVSGNIELVMRPVPKANVVIPISLTVPTIVGTATLTSEKVDITMPDQQRIALRR